MDTAADPAQGLLAATATATAAATTPRGIPREVVVGGPGRLYPSHHYLSTICHHHHPRPQSTNISAAQDQPAAAGGDSTTATTPFSASSPSIISGTSWDFRYEELRTFYRQFGHTNVPISTFPILGGWTRRQQREYALYRATGNDMESTIHAMSHERIVKLMVLNFRWRENEEQRQQNEERNENEMDNEMMVDNHADYPMDNHDASENEESEVCYIGGTAEDENHNQDEEEDRGVLGDALLQEQQQQQQNINEEEEEDQAKRQRELKEEKRNLVILKAARRGELFPERNAAVPHQPTVSSSLSIVQQQQTAENIRNLILPTTAITAQQQQRQEVVQPPFLSGKTSIANPLMFDPLPTTTTPNMAGPPGGPLAASATAITSNAAINVHASTTTIAANATATPLASTTTSNSSVATAPPRPPAIQIQPPTFDLKDSLINLRKTNNNYGHGLVALNKTKEKRNPKNGLTPDEERLLLFEEKRKARQQQQAAGIPRQTIRKRRHVVEEDEFGNSVLVERRTNGYTKSLLRELLPEEFEPGPWSVIVGRDKASIEAMGNKRLHVTVATYLERYATSTIKGEKTTIISEIEKKVRTACGEVSLAPDKDGKDRHGKAMGAFIKYSDGRWWEVEPWVAREKIGRTLREPLHAKYSSSSKTKRARNRQNINRRQQRNRQRKAAMMRGEKILRAQATEQRQDKRAAKEGGQQHLSVSSGDEKNMNESDYGDKQKLAAAGDVSDKIGRPTDTILGQKKEDIGGEEKKDNGNKPAITTPVSAIL